MISITAKTFDLLGSVQLHKVSTSKLPPLSRRLTNTATIDGGNVITDLGLSEADGQWALEIYDIGVRDSLEWLIKNHSRVRISTKSGVFEGGIKQLDIAVTPIKLLFLAEKKLT